MASRAEQSHSGPRPELADFWRQLGAYLIGLAFAELARKDLEHGRDDAFDVVVLRSLCAKALP